MKFFNGPTYSLNNNWMNLVQVKSLYTKSKSLKKIINLFEKKGSIATSLELKSYAKTFQIISNL